MTNVHSVQIGRIMPLGPDAIPSGFVKAPVPNRTRVRALGLEGDEQADLRVHGGLEKAVYGYSLHHYDAWRADFAEHSATLIAGAFGENLTIGGMTETDICVGDVHRIGTAMLQVCQPRQPCFKLALHFNDRRLPRAMLQSGRSGWYYRVLCEGEIGPGDEIALIDRPYPHFPFPRLVAFANFGTAPRADLIALSQMEEVASGLRRRASQMLSSGDQVRISED